MTKMTRGETCEFILSGNKCTIAVQDDCFEIKTLPKDSKLSVEDASQSVKLIPFFELISVNFIDPSEIPADGRSKPGINIANRTKLSYVEIKTVKRSKDHKWKLTQMKLKSSNKEHCENLAKILSKKLSGFTNSRPKALLIFVNPYGGTGSAKSIYDKKVAPVFDEAGIKTIVITTDHKHHAKDYVKENDLLDYDGIIAVGGDGMLNEVINGLLTKTQSSMGAEIHTTYRKPRNTPKYHRPSLRVGVIPAGSTDTVSYVTQGINDAETSALHIALGDSHPVDVVSLHNAEGLLQQFALSLTGYGYFGDMLRHSENFRWMGPPRYTFVGANVFLKNKSYSGEVHYLPADIDTDPRTSSFCRAPCPICQAGLEETEAPLFTPLTPSHSFNLSITGEDNEAKNTEDLPKLIRNRSISEGFNLDGEELNPDIISDFAKLQESVFKSDDVVDKPSDTETPIKFTISEETAHEYTPAHCDEIQACSNRPTSLQMSPRAEGLLKEDSEDWKVIKGEFMSINGVAMSCACERSPLGLSPHSHLSDGAIDLIVVKACSRLEFLRYMMAHTGKGDRFDFPYVEVHRVKAFQFIPSLTNSFLPAYYDETLPSPSSITTETSGGESIHLSLPELRVKYKRRSTKNENKKEKKCNRKMKRSQSETHAISKPVSTWNSDGEIIQEANMTVRVHRGLILMFCRGIENIDR